MEKFDNIVSGIEHNNNTPSRELYLMTNAALDAQKYIDERVMHQVGITREFLEELYEVVRTLDAFAVDAGLFGARLTMYGNKLCLPYTSQDSSSLLGFLDYGENLQDESSSDTGIFVYGEFNGFHLKTVQIDRDEEGSVDVIGSQPVAVKLCYHVAVGTFSNIHAAGVRYAHAPVDSAQLFFENVEWYEASCRLKQALEDSHDTSVTEELAYVEANLDELHDDFTNESIMTIRNIGEALNALSRGEKGLPQKAKDALADMIKLKLQAISDDWICETPRIIIIGSIDEEDPDYTHRSLQREESTFKIRSELYDVQWVKYDGGEVPAITMKSKIVVGRDRDIEKFVCIPLAAIQNLIPVE